MVGKQTRATASQVGKGASRAKELPFSVELWDAGASDRIERILARAFNPTLAQAIFTAARNEYPDRRITLRQGKRILSDSAQ